MYKQKATETEVTCTIKLHKYPPHPLLYQNIIISARNGTFFSACLEANTVYNM
jgi:hypothetical protein